MTQEEKAQRYDEAIIKVKALYGQPLVDNTLLETIFPELKESEDERIRKELITWLQNTEGQVLPIDRYKAALAWLEKQGKQKSIWHNEDEEPQRGSLILLIMQSGNPIVAKIIEPNHTFNHGERWAYIDDLLEKQGKHNKNHKTMIVKFICKKDWHGIGDYYYGKIYNGYPCEKEQKGYDIYDDNHVPTFCDEDFINEYFNIVTEEKQSEQLAEPDWCHHKVDLSNCSDEYRKAYYDGWNNCNMQHSQCKSDGNDVVKCLINGMKFYYEDNEEATWGTEKFSMKIKDILSWLEKQGKQKSIWHNEDEEPKRGSLILLIMQSGTPIVAKIIEPNHTFNHGERWAYIDDLLEKQDKQKVNYTTLVETGNGGINALVTRELSTNDYEEEPAEKVEPKFKVKYAGNEYNVFETKEIAGVTFYGIEDEPKHIDYVKAENCEIISGGYDIKENGCSFPTNPIIFSEQKPAEWSEDDEKMLADACIMLDWYQGNNWWKAQHIKNWIKALKQRIGG